MASLAESDFGDFAKEARLKKGLGLRQAARLMSISAAYLSRVENNVDLPSGRLIHRMSELYEVSIEELTSSAKKSKATGAAFAHAMRAIPELRALYRLRGQFDPGQIEEILRTALRKMGTPEEEIDKKLADIKLELPRINNSGRDNLFAAQVTLRFLSAKRIAELASRVLIRNGMFKEQYLPPTPIELIVENEPDVSYRIDELRCDKFGAPLVLGLTGWDAQGRRQIVLNSKLADSDRTSDQCRFNFTLAHELFHALEHLPRVPKQTSTSLARTQVFVNWGVSHPSVAEKAVARWTKTNDPRCFTTQEDWREWQANTFASALLMPEWAIRTEFRARVGSDATCASATDLREAALKLADQTEFETGDFDQSLAQLFAVSRQAMAIRLLQLKIVKEAAA